MGTYCNNHFYILTFYPMFLFHSLLFFNLNFKQRQVPLTTCNTWLCITKSIKKNLNSHSPTNIYKYLALTSSLTRMYLYCIAVVVFKIPFISHLSFHDFLFFFSLNLFCFACHLFHYAYSFRYTSILRYVVVIFFTFFIFIHS